MTTRHQPNDADTTTPRTKVTVQNRHTAHSSEPRGCCRNESGRCAPPPPESHTDGGRLTRRQVLLGSAVVATATLAGCITSDGPEDEPAEPISLGDGQVCDVCGMVIEDHYGPAGQVFYATGGPEDRDGPAHFDSVSELVVHHDDQLAGGAETRAVFVTDYSSVDYQLEEHDGEMYISRHVGEETFADATTLSFVVESAVEGAMGPDYIPFSEVADADAFVEEHGGDILEWHDLTADGD